jgi:hypothetical protein
MFTPGFVVPSDRLPLAAGRVTFICRVSPAGAIAVSTQSFRVVKPRRFVYLRLVVDSGRGRLTASRKGQVVKRRPYTLYNN